MRWEGEREKEKEKEKEVVELKKALKAWRPSTRLEVDKASVEAELEKIQNETLVMLDESFNKVVRQAYLLYNEPPLVDDFEANKNIYEGRLVPFDELETLKNTKPRTSTEDVEDEDR